MKLLKQWVHEEAERLGVPVTTIRGRIERGKYKHLKLRKKSSCRVFVVEK